MKKNILIVCLVVLVLILAFGLYIKTEQLEMAEYNLYLQNEKIRQLEGEQGYPEKYENHDISTQPSY